jgi:hypothetical protein
MNKKEQIHANKIAYLRMNLEKGDKVLVRQMGFNKHRIPDYMNNKWVTIEGISSHWTPYTYTGRKTVEIDDPHMTRRKPFHYDDIVALARKSQRVSLIGRGNNEY